MQRAVVVLVNNCGPSADGEEGEEADYGEEGERLEEGEEGEKEEHAWRAGGGRGPHKRSAIAVQKHGLWIAMHCNASLDRTCGVDPGQPGGTPLL